MGSRRANSLSEIVGSGLGTEQGSLTRAIGHKDPESIASSSAKLAAKSENISNILYYVSKLVDFVLKEAKSKEDLNSHQREQLARQEWSRIKREEGLKDDPVVTKTIVSAVAKAIGKGRK